VRAVAQASLALNVYIQNESPSGDLPELLGLRNRAQWLSLSLQRDTDNWECTEALAEEDEFLFDIMRTTLLIYTNLVIFPLPPASGVDTRLSTSLKSKLQATIQQWPVFAKVHPRLFLWTLVLGGISDSKNVERQWYREMLRRLLSEELPTLRKWSQIESCLKACMWQSDVLNDEAISLWADCRS
jgi:hypothetical protein